MVDIYSIQINSNLDNDIMDSLKQLVSEERREKVERFKFQQDSLRSLLGDLLSRYAICTRTRYKNCQLKFALNAYNKPVLAEIKNLHFNVSHSGNWVVCAIADEVVGIDVEEIKPIDYGIAKSFFTEEEYCNLISHDEENRLKYFYSIWTLKESYLKADGRGLSLPLNSFSIDIKHDKISVVTSNELSNCYFKKYDIDNLHISSVCSLDKNFRDTIKELTVDSLIQTLE